MRDSLSITVEGPDIGVWAAAAVLESDMPKAAGRPPLRLVGGEESPSSTGQDAR